MDGLAKTLDKLLDKKFDEKLEAQEERLDKKFDEKLQPIKDDQKAIRKEMATKDDLKNTEKRLSAEIISAVNETSRDAIKSNEERIDKLERHTDHPPLAI